MESRRPATLLSCRIDELVKNTIVPMDLALLTPSASSSFDRELDDVDNNSTVKALREHSKELDSLIMEMGVGVSPRSLLDENEDDEVSADQYSIARAEDVLRRELEAAEQFMKGIKNEVFDEERDSNTCRKRESNSSKEETREEWPISPSLCGVDWTHADCWNHLAVRQTALLEPENDAECNDSVDKLPHQNQVVGVPNESSELAVRRMPPSNQVSGTPRTALLSVLLSWTDSADSLLLSPEHVIGERKTPHNGGNQKSSVSRFEFYDSLCAVLSPRCLDTLSSTFSEESDDGLPFLRNERLSTISEGTDSRMLGSNSILSSRVRLAEPSVDPQSTEMLQHPTSTDPATFTTKSSRQLTCSSDEHTQEYIPDIVDSKARDPILASRSKEMTQYPLPSLDKEMHELNVGQDDTVIEKKAIPSLISSNSTSSAEPCFDEYSGKGTSADNAQSRSSIERNLDESLGLKSLDGEQKESFAEKSLENLETQMTTYRDLLDLLKCHLEHSRCVKSSPRLPNDTDEHDGVEACASDNNSSRIHPMRLCLTEELGVGQTFGDVLTPAAGSSPDQISPLPSGSDKDDAEPDFEGNLESHTSLESLLRRKSDSPILATDSQAHEALDNILAESSSEKSMQSSTTRRLVEVSEAIVDTNTSVGIEVVPEALVNVGHRNRSMSCNNDCSIMQTLARTYARSQLRQNEREQELSRPLEHQPMSNCSSLACTVQRESRRIEEGNINNVEYGPFVERSMIEADSEDTSVSNFSTETKPATCGWGGCCGMPCTIDNKYRLENGGDPGKFDEREPNNSYPCIFREDSDQNGVEVIYTETRESNLDSDFSANDAGRVSCAFDVNKSTRLDRRDLHQQLQNLANEGGVEGLPAMEEPQTCESTPLPATPAIAGNPILATKPGRHPAQTHESGSHDHNGLTMSRRKEFEREYLKIPSLKRTNGHENKICQNRRKCPWPRPDVDQTSLSADESEQSWEEMSECEAENAQVCNEVRQLEDTAELIKCTEKLLGAIVGYNYTVYKELVTCDLTGVDKGSLEEIVSQKRFHSYHFRHARNQSKKGRVALEKPVVRFLTQDIAIISYVRIDSRHGNHDNVFKCTESRVWERREGRWVNSHYHTSL